MLFKATRLVVAFSLCLLLTGCTLPFINTKKAGLSVTATPNAGVFLDGKHISSTPYYNEKLRPGEYTLKIVPESGLGLPWESQITLSPGIMTVISRQLGPTEDSSSGYMLTLQPNTVKDKTQLDVVTTPDKSIVSIDGESKGFSPKSLDDLSSGEHILLVTAPGYIERSISANLQKGHVLRASVQLARSEIAIEQTAQEATPSPQPQDEVIDEKPAKTTPKPTAKTATPKAEADLKPPYITVLDTPTGFLNVREEPSTASDNVIAKIKPGESYRLIEKNQTGWYKIEVSPDEEGWIVSRYVRLIEK